MDAELAAQVGATVYEVGIYCSIRDPSGNAESFDRIVKQTCSDFHALTNARVVRGRHLALQGFTATLPLGVDPLRATRRYAQRNIAHCVPLTSSRCGCPDGLILGTADPGGTIERLDPYDRQFATTLTLIVGKGGGGKTVTIDPARLPVHRPGRADLHHRPQLHPRRPRRQHRHRPLRHAPVADSRRAAGAARDRARRGHLPVGRRPTSSTSPTRRSSSCSRCTRC